MTVFGHAPKCLKKYKSNQIKVGITLAKLKPSIKIVDHKCIQKLYGLDEKVQGLTEKVNELSSRFDI